jgi:hypothetical protein
MVIFSRQLVAMIDFGYSGAAVSRVRAFLACGTATAKLIPKDNVSQGASGGILKANSSERNDVIRRQNDP